MTTASTIRDALRRHYGASEQHTSTHIAFEVTSGTGRYANRRVDAVVMDLWPSRGYTLHAMEIKVSQSDLKRELKDGAKSEDVAQHCDLFSIVAPLGMVKLSQLPLPWGLIEVDASDALRFTKPAKRTRARAVDRAFLASVMRACARPISRGEVELKLKAEREKLYADMNERIESAVKMRAADGTRWRELMRDIDGSWYDDATIKAAVRMVLEAGILGSYGSLQHIHKDLKKKVEDIGKTLQKFMQIKQETIVSNATSGMSEEEIEKIIKNGLGE